MNGSFIKSICKRGVKMGILTSTRAVVIVWATAVNVTFPDRLHGRLFI